MANDIMIRFTYRGEGYGDVVGLVRALRIASGGKFDYGMKIYPPNITLADPESVAKILKQKYGEEAASAPYNSEYYADDEDYELHARGT